MAATMPALTTSPNPLGSRYTVPGMALLIGGVPMSEILTNTGLMLPDNCTEEDFFEAGRFLSRIEQGMQWAIGDWYNAIPWGDKAAACEKAGLNFTTARIYGNVCAVFQIDRRLSNLSFDKHQRLVNQELTHAQRSELLDKSAENGWSVARLMKERDRLLGKDERVPLLTFDTKVEKLMETLPASATKKTKAALTHVVNDLRHDFETEVEHVVKERLKAQRDKLHELEKEAKEELDRARNLSMNLDGLMTEEEYRLIRGCLHPDRAPDDRKSAFSKAFDVFTRLEKTVNRNMPAKLRKQSGWA
jgi:hypothetical protein